MKYPLVAVVSSQTSSESLGFNSSSRLLVVDPEARDSGILKSRSALISL